MKKNLFRSVIGLFMAVIYLLGGCSSDKGSSGGGQGSVANTTDRDVVYRDTDVVLTSSGASEGYVIVVSEDAAWEISLGSRDLQEFIESSTGVALPIVYDTDLSFNAEEKRILVGQSKATENCGIEFDYNELGKDGFVIKTIGKSVVIAGAKAAGAMFGVYDFLWYNFGVRIYASNEFKIPDHTKDTVYLKDFNHKNVPDFAERAMGVNERYDDMTCYRLGLNRSHGENWYTWCHTYFQLLPPSQYYSEHPDWYSKDGAQLCLSNDEMIAALVEVIKNKITESTRDGGLFMIGHEDNNSFCDCEKCKRLAAENGGNSGVMMLFINKIADIMNPWVKENKPGATVKWITFAYGTTTNAPVAINNGEYKAVNESVIPHENVGVMIAPLGSDWAHNMADPVYNERYYHMFMGWKALGPEFYIYSYSVVFDRLFIHMDNWSTVKNQYKLWLDLDCKFIFEEGGWGNLPFYEMVNYVHTRMLWDTDSDVEYYIIDFIDNYYKAGAPYVKKYFNLIRTRYKLIEREMNQKNQTFSLRSFVRYAPEMLSEEYWPKDWLLSAISVFDEALEACENMENEEDKERAIKRIKAERLSPIYILMELYKHDITNADVQYYIDEFREGTEINGITTVGQIGTVFSTIASWMSVLEE